jgi:hypothetical protein
MAVKFEPNLATLIPLGAMAVAISVGWGQLTTTVASIDTRLDAMEAAARGDDSRLRSAENSLSSMSARLDGISESLAEIKSEARDTNMLLRGYFEKGTKP